MISSSKLIHFGTIHVLEAILSGQSDNNSAYFTCGNPIFFPMTLRGSIWLKLNPSFLEQNSAWIDFGSVIDVGGRLFGLFPDLPGDCEIPEMNGPDFLNLIQEFTSAGLTGAISKHTKQTGADIILRRYLSPSLCDWIDRATSPHAWFFEYRLSPGFSINPHNVDFLLIPNTYLPKSIFRNLKRKGVPIKTYNPRQGLENEAHLCSWSL